MEHTDDHKGMIKYRRIALIVALLINLINSLSMVRQTIYLGYRVISRPTSWMDLVIIICVFLICLQLVNEDLNIKVLRSVEAMLIVFIWFKSIYFLRLIDEISPLVDMIAIILDDIKYFVAIFIIALIAFV